MIGFRQCCMKYGCYKTQTGRTCKVWETEQLQTNGFRDIYLFIWKIWMNLCMDSYKSALQRVAAGDRDSVAQWTARDYWFNEGSNQKKGSNTSAALYFHLQIKQINHGWHYFYKWVMRIYHWSWMSYLHALGVHSTSWPNYRQTELHCISPEFS